MRRCIQKNSNYAKQVFFFAFTACLLFISLILDQCHSCIKIIIAQALIAAAKKEGFQFFVANRGREKNGFMQPSQKTVTAVLKKSRTVVRDTWWSENENNECKNEIGGQENLHTSEEQKTYKVSTELDIQAPA